MEDFYFEGTFVERAEDGTWKYWTVRDLTGKNNIVAIKRLK